MAFTGKPTGTTAIIISNDGFWPDLALLALIEDYRIPASDYTDNVIRTGLVTAMIYVNDKLQAAKDAIILLEYATLADYTAAHSSQIDDKELLAHHYEKAVYCHAKAFLLQQFNSLNRKPNAENQAKESPETEAYWLDQSQHAIYLLMKAVLPDTETPSQNGFAAVLI